MRGDGVRCKRVAGVFVVSEEVVKGCVQLAIPPQGKPLSVGKRKSLDALRLSSEFQKIRNFGSSCAVQKTKKLRASSTPPSCLQCAADHTPHCCQRHSPTSFPTFFHLSLPSPRFQPNKPSSHLASGSRVPPP